MIYFLWTDKCFLAVLLIALACMLAGLRKTPVRDACKDILSRPIATSAGLVFLLFLAIGILDSIHVKPGRPDSSQSALQEHPDTLLDCLLAPIGQIQEKTYSAPFALRLYTKEVITVDGKAQEVYPRLIYPAKNIHNEAQKQRFIMQVLLMAMGLTALLLAAYSALLFGWQRFFSKTTPALLRPLPFFTAGMLLFVCIAMFCLSRDFHILGTGKIGQDIFYFSVKSIRTGLVIGILTTLIMLPLALLLGILAGYFGGVVDDAVQYLYTTLSSIPGVLLITASVLSMQTYIANHPEKFPTAAKSADARLFALCLILGVTSWTSLCRLLRAETLKLRQLDFILAARALGSNAWFILRKHLLPNVMAIVLITLVLDFSFLVLAEAVLAYVGVGVSPMTISWGNMINGARLELAREPLVWWPILSAFVFMFTLVLASNLFADAVRDAFDPHHRPV